VLPVIVPDSTETDAGVEPGSAAASATKPAGSLPLQDRIEIIVPTGYRVIAGADIHGDAERRVLAVVATR